MSDSSTSLNYRCVAVGCRDSIGIRRDTAHAHGLGGGHLNHALDLVCAYLGWRKDISNGEDVLASIYCPFHAKDMVCVRCRMETCSCSGGPRFEAVRE